MNKILDMLFEQVVAKMPSTMQKEIKSKVWRKDQLRKYGTDVFLDPVAMKFPIMYNGKYDCRMIHAAILHATMFSKHGSSMNKPKYYKSILKKAKDIYRNNKCENEINIKVQESDDCEISASEILEIYCFEE